MQSVRRRLSLILIICTVSAVLLSALFVNITMERNFNKYMADVQNKRNNRIVEYFQQIYKRDNGWNKSSGQEMMHEAYMSNYCLTLLDQRKNVVWGMDANLIKLDPQMHSMMASGLGKGVYTSKTFNIDVNGKTVGYVMIGQYYSLLLSDQDINFKKSINIGIALSVLITIFIIVIVSLRISSQFSIPIKKVSDTSVELSRGNYSFRSNVNSNIIEINNLIDSINKLGEKLESQDLLRKRLVSDISHEIRTPLNVLQNNIEAMIDGILPTTKERLNSLNDEIIRFGKLLNNLNSLKRFETEDIILNIKDIFLDDIILEVCDDFMLAAKDMEININLDFHSKKYKMQGDEDRLKQVFINLISNALKFNRPGGTIWVYVEESKDKIIVKVKDNGVGIKKNDIPYVFERLYRGDKSRHEVEGNGIGLTIVKKILIMHSASIDVESEFGKGTIFTIYFNKPTI
ncbi:MAG: resE5 [Clostridiaceae bacterium]|jgi:signal transduction histidine kinase|nr:resE5 [Clostridiaceae bacterium]